MKSRKLLGIFVVVFVCSLYFTVKTFAQQAPPPVFGCLGLGGQQCSFLQVGPPKTDLTVNKKTLRGTKRIVHYGDTITGSISYTNTGNLPLNVSKVGVVAKPLKGKYEVMFTPSQGQTVLQPGQSINLATTFHKFNYPDPPGDWSVAGRVVNTDNQSVDGNNPDIFTLVADCTPLRAVKDSGALEKDAAKINSFCQGKKDGDAGFPICREFCEVAPDIATNCAATNQPPGAGQDPNASQPGQLNPQVPDAGQSPQPQQPNQNPDPNASNPGQPNQPNDPNTPNSPNIEPTQPQQQEIPAPTQQPDTQQPDTPNNGTTNPVQQIQQQFQQFIDDLKRIFGL